MRKIWVAAAVLACLGLAGMVAGRRPEGASAAPSPAQVEASYGFVNYTVNGTSLSDQDKEKWRQNPLHLLPAQDRQPPTYWWTGIRAPYHWIRSGQGLELECRKQWTGEVQRNNQLTLTWKQVLGKPEDQGGAVFYHEITLGRGPLQLNALPPQPNCKQESLGGSAPRLLAEGAGSRPAITAQNVPERTLEGELLLTVNRTNTQLPKATEADFRLWECLVTRGVPNVEFTPQGGGQQSRKEAFVWPDGRFQVELSPSVRYTWFILPSGCGIGRFEAGALKGDESISAGRREKIALACYVMASPSPRYAACHAWWLARP